jgi:serine/threonine protein kinase
MKRPNDLYGRPWSEREYILVLDSYFAHKGEPLHHLSAYVKEMAALLGRTPASIAMRLENYASIDPEETGQKGLGNIGPMGKKVFSDWNAKRDHLKSVAEVLAREERVPEQLNLFEPEPAIIPQAFGKYELLDIIGSGALGVVYSCLDVESNTKRAIKVIKAEKLGDKESLHRFLREIRAVKAVNHPNIIKLHEDNIDTEKDFPAYVMELADANLTAYATVMSAVAGGNRPRSGLEPQESICIIRSILSAIKTLHANKPRIIHRDINPNNILRLSDGSWVLSDFSLVKFLQTAPLSTSFLTTAQAGWGTAYYTAPEQYRNFADADEKADIYAVGILIWELFTSSTPPPDRSDLGLSPKLSVLVSRATARDPQKRFATISDLSDDFESAVVSDQYPTNTSAASK